MKKITIVFLIIFLLLYGSEMVFASSTSYFSDLNGYSWAEEYINEFAEKKIVSGVSDNLFEPGRDVKREEFVKVIVNLFEYDPYNAESNFEDVAKDSWYYPYVSVAVKEGIVNGISATQFGSGKFITRQDMCVILYRTLQNKGYGLKEKVKDEISFEDMDEISDYAIEAVTKLYKAGVINGISKDRFAPKDNANRAQMVKVAYLCDSNKKESKTVSVKSISFEKASIEMEIGEELHLDYTIKPDNATNKKVTWSSSNKSVVKVENGIVTALKSGKATITAKTANDKSATCKITVASDKEEPTKPSGGGGGGSSSGGSGGGGSSENISVTGISLNKTAISLEVKATEKITATVTPSNATNKKVTWSSSDTSVAEVENGRVTAKKEGSATITAKTSDGGKTATCTVKVSPQTIISVTGVSLNETLLTLDINGTATLTATVAPNNASNKKVTWSSSDSSVAKVEDGKVTALKAGSATITVKTVDGGKTATCSVKVNAQTTPTQPATIPVTGVSLDKMSLTFDTVSEVKLTATVTPNNATNKNVTWSSSNEKVVTVKDGMVSVVGEGTATVTVKTVDGGKTATCAVTVKGLTPPPTTIPVTGVSLDKTSLTFDTVSAVKLTATVTPNNATNKNVTWSSSNEKVVTVKDGMVSVVGEGTATVTVKTVDGGKTATCAVKVQGLTPPPTVTPTTVAVTGVELDKISLFIDTMSATTLKATVLPTNATNKNVTWKSSNTKIVSVDSKGMVSTVGEGTATITVTTVDGGKTATCTVRVQGLTPPPTAVPVQSVKLSSKLSSLKVGEKGTLTVTITPTNATNQTVTWTSSDTNIATVSKGKVVAKKEGNVTITASVDGKAAKCTILVIEKDGWHVIKDNKKYYWSYYKDGSETLRLSKMIYVHRGWGKEYPENSLASFKAVKKNGYYGFETDIRFTKDNVPVLIHDGTINRVARKSDLSELKKDIYVKDLTYAELEKYSFCVSRTGKVLTDYKDNKITKFEDALKYAKNNGLTLSIHLKVGSQEQIESLVKMVQKYNMDNVVRWMSGNKKLLLYLNEIDDDELIRFIPDNQTEEELKQIRNEIKTSNNVVFDRDKTASYETANMPEKRDEFDINKYIVGQGTSTINVAI